MYDPKGQLLKMEQVTSEILGKSRHNRIECRDVYRPDVEAGFTYLWPQSIFLPICNWTLILRRTIYLFSFKILACDPMEFIFDWAAT